MTANIITFSRILFSLFLLAFPPYSSPFAAFYLLCGATDALAEDQKMPFNFKKIQRIFSAEK